MAKTKGRASRTPPPRRVAPAPARDARSPDGGGTLARTFPASGRQAQPHFVQAAVLAEQHAEGTLQPPAGSAPSPALAGRPRLAVRAGRSATDVNVELLDQRSRRPRLLLELAPNAPRGGASGRGCQSVARAVRRDQRLVKGTTTKAAALMTGPHKRPGPTRRPSAPTGSSARPRPALPPARCRRRCGGARANRTLQSTSRRPAEPSRTTPPRRPAPPASPPSALHGPRTEEAATWAGCSGCERPAAARAGLERRPSQRRTSGLALLTRLHPLTASRTWRRRRRARPQPAPCPERR